MARNQISCGIHPKIYIKIAYKHTKKKRTGRNSSLLCDRFVTAKRAITNEIFTIRQSRGGAGTSAAAAFCARNNRDIVTGLRLITCLETFTNARPRTSYSGFASRVRFIVPGPKRRNQRSGAGGGAVSVRTACD
ncbi:hypothetical protein EVAR_33931_1 [Eumeta japonica]|uniref:Uncharacterized protein n=1 Tax=Eumeta variegata TaxID=151549 RepID=A0A4C1VX80_EUMVA|nr:hypothetical protein EVAR_33931_1 [Eumeta japonica]